MRKIISILLVLSFSYAQQYGEGDSISLENQNISYSVCNGTSDYPLGSAWSLADYNGNLNGSNYKVLMFDIVATW